MSQIFNMPSMGELSRMTEEQLKPLFFELERHRSKCLVEASNDYVSAVEKIEKDYGNRFHILANALAKARRKTPSEVLA